MCTQEAPPNAKFRNPTHLVDKFVLFLSTLFLVPDRAVLNLVVSVHSERPGGYQSHCVCGCALHEPLMSNPVSNYSTSVDFCPQRENPCFSNRLPDPLPQTAHSTPKAGSVFVRNLCKQSPKLERANGDSRRPREVWPSTVVMPNSQCCGLSWPVRRTRESLRGAGLHGWQ